MGILPDCNIDVSLSFPAFLCNPSCILFLWHCLFILLYQYPMKLICCLHIVFLLVDVICGVYVLESVFLMFDYHAYRRVHICFGFSVAVSY